MTEPLCIDLFCGDGGWTDAFLDAGFRVVGYDVVRRRRYRGELVLQDVRTIAGRSLARWRPAVVVASPPCQGFSEARVNPDGRSARGHDGRYLHDHGIDTGPSDAGLLRPAPADLELVLHTLRVIREAAPRFWAVENVRGAMGWFEPMLGPPRFANKPWYVWGTFPTFLLRKDYLGDKSRFRSAALRARIPGDLARPLARAIMDALVTA